ncbi:MAG: homoserine O-acetyltransferase [Rhodoluna sp.]|nr:homoserine O-acetyltransferase [Rhodoluna sp.]
MEFQTSEDTVPSAFITEELSRQLIGRPPATGAWRDGDPAGDRQFAPISNLKLESGRELASARIAFETWGEPNADKSNAVLVLHALTGDSHAIGGASKQHPTEGWWNGIIGPGLSIDTDKWWVIAPNMLGGCQGSTGPSSLSSNGIEYGASFPFVTIRDQVAAQKQFAEVIGVTKWAAVIGGSMGGMQALEWAIEHPELVERLAVIAAPPVSTADHIALNSVQVEAIMTDPAFADGNYYDAKPGFGPHRGLALARRMALLNYRSPSELNERFERSWQSNVNPLGGGGRFAVESYLDFHGNKFTRRFDANSYIILVDAMNSHDIARGRESIENALSKITATTLVAGITSDRLFPIDGQKVIADGITSKLIGDKLHVIESAFGHDGFLIEREVVGPLIAALLAS